MSGETQAPSLNLAGRLARGFLGSKITVLIMLALTLFGALAIEVTPRLYNPEIVVPAASIFVIRPGNSPEEIQNQVVRPLEALMASLAGVKHSPTRHVVYGQFTCDQPTHRVDWHVCRAPSPPSGYYGGVRSSNHAREGPRERPLFSAGAAANIPARTINFFPREPE